MVAAGKLLFGSIPLLPVTSVIPAPTMAAAPRTVAEGTKRVKKGLPAMLKGRLVPKISVKGWQGRCMPPRTVQLEIQLLFNSESGEVEKCSEVSCKCSISFLV